MTTTLKINSFIESRLCSECIVIESTDPNMYTGKRMYVDLTVNADFGDVLERDLVGKTVEVDRFEPFELIGVGVRIKEEA